MDDASSRAVLGSEDSSVILENKKADAGRSGDEDEDELTDSTLNATFKRLLAKGTFTKVMSVKSVGYRKHIDLIDIHRATQRLVSAEKTKVSSLVNSLKKMKTLDLFDDDANTDAAGISQKSDTDEDKEINVSNVSERRDNSVARAASSLDMLGSQIPTGQQSALQLANTQMLHAVAPQELYRSAAIASDDQLKLVADNSSNAKSRIEIDQVKKDLHQLTAELKRKEQELAWWNQANAELEEEILKRLEFADAEIPRQFDDAEDDVGGYAAGGWIGCSTDKFIRSEENQDNRRKMNPRDRMNPLITRDEDKDSSAQLQQPGIQTQSDKDDDEDMQNEHPVMPRASVQPQEIQDQSPAGSENTGFPESLCEVSPAQHCSQSETSHQDASELETLPSWYQDQRMLCCASGVILLLAVVLLFCDLCSFESDGLAATFPDN